MDMLSRESPEYPTNMRLSPSRHGRIFKSERWKRKYIMMKKTVMITALLILTAGAVFAGSYKLDETESLDLSGIDEVVFDLTGVNCALCIRTIDVVSELRGDGRGRNMELSLSGDVSSNRKKAVPTLIQERRGRTLTIRLYPDKQTFFGLTQSGTAHFNGTLPASFNGEVRAVTSSGDMTARDFSLGILELDSSSGNMTVEGVESTRISLELSSGNLNGNRLTAAEGLNIRSSSGKITLGSASAGENLVVKASSGSITADSLRGEEVLLDSSSGRIHVEHLEAGETGIRTSSDVTIENGRGAMNIRGSSSDIDVTLTALDGPVDMDVSSGEISLSLPEGSAFDVSIETSSGRIRNDFPILSTFVDRDRIEGTVNGGGPLLKLETSSGDITLIRN